MRSFWLSEKNDNFLEWRTISLLAVSGSATGTSGRVKVTISKRQQAANQKAERLLKLWAMMAEAPTARGIQAIREEIMDEIWKLRLPMPLEQDQLPTKNDILKHEDYLVRQGKMNPTAPLVLYAPKSWTCLFRDLIVIVSGSKY